VIVGMPLVIEQKIFDCAIVLNSGYILSVRSETPLPTHREFYEDRWFPSGKDVRSNTIELSSQRVPFGPDIIFGLQGIDSAVIGVEIYEDLRVPLVPMNTRRWQGQQR